MSESEYASAVRLANKVLDEPGRDPDDDLSMMSRQFLRRVTWAPIETAPKERTLLLFAVTSTNPSNWKMATGYWNKGYGTDPGYWVWEGRELKAYDVQPTHWLALPPEPPR